MEIAGAHFSDHQNKAKKQSTHQTASTFQNILVSNLEQSSPHAAIKAADEVYKDTFIKDKKKKQLDVEESVLSESTESPSVMKTIHELKKRLRLVRAAERKSLGL